MNLLNYKILKNKKIIPKLDEELIPDKDIIRSNILSNINKFTNLYSDYNNHIRLDLNSVNDISYIPTNNSFSFFPELNVVKLKMFFGQKTVQNQKMKIVEVGNTKLQKFITKQKKYT